MRKVKVVVCASTLTAFALLAMACGAVQQGVQAAKDAMALTQIGQVYRSYCNTNMKGPSSVDELMKSATTQPEKDAVQEIKDGKFNAEWNVNVNDANTGGSGAVLVYTATATNGVRVALMADCVKVETFQEADFQAKPKAKSGTTLPAKDKPAVKKDKL